MSLTIQLQLLPTAQPKLTTKNLLLAICPKGLTDGSEAVSAIDLLLRREASPLGLLKKKLATCYSLLAT